MDVDNKIDTKTRASKKIIVGSVLVVVGLAVAGVGFAALGIISYPSDIKGKNLTAVWNAIKLLDNNQTMIYGFTNSAYAEFFVNKIENNERFKNIENRVDTLEGSKESICGDGVLDPGEDCDPDPWNDGRIAPEGTSCQLVGADGGTLKCAFNCQYETSECYVAF